MYFKNIKMKESELFCDRARGFTLIEVIVALVLAAILGTMLVTFMETGIAESAKTLARVKNTYDLGQVIENITAGYKSLLATDATPLATLKTYVGATGTTQNPNAHGYGSYKVNYNDYKTFACTGSSCTEGNGGSSILKVTITDPDNTQTITALFAQ